MKNLIIQSGLLILKIRETPEKISFNMILNLASVCNAESSEIGVL